jgi:hypothetical protein
MDLAKNYDRALLVVGGVLALVGGGYFASQASGYGSKFLQEEVSQGNKLDALPLDNLTAALDGLSKTPVTWEPPKLGAHKAISLLSSSPFVVKKDDQDTPIDMLAEDTPPLRGSIDNYWWVANNIDYTSVSAAEDDPDGDGFSNLDEFKEKTDPRSQLSRPQPITKLYYTGRTAEPLSLRLTSYDASSASASIRWEGTPDAAGKGSRTEYLRSGASFYNNRFVADVVMVKDTFNTEGSPLKLVQGVAVDRPTYVANFTFGLTGKTYTAKADTDFSLDGQSVTIEVKEIGAEHVIISFVPNGKVAPETKRIEKSDAPKKETPPTK